MKAGDKVLIEGTIASVSTNGVYATVLIPMQRDSGGYTPLPVAINTELLKGHYHRPQPTEWR